MGETGYSEERIIRVLREVELLSAAKAPTEALRSEW